MHNQCKSYAEQSTCVDALAGKCQELRKRLGYSDPDARSVALNNLISISRACQMHLNLMDSWNRGDEGVRQVIPQLIGLQTVTVESVNMSGDYLNKFSRLGFGVLAQFQIENVLRNISRELGIKRNSTGFYRTASSLLKILNIPDDRMDILNVPARIRNSLHANGIHHRSHPSEKETVIIEGIEYTFKDGERVSCAGWEHIAHAFSHSVGVLDEIFHTPEVMALSDPLMDRYAWEMSKDT